MAPAPLLPFLAEAGPEKHQPVRENQEHRLGSTIASQTLNELQKHVKSVVVHHHRYNHVSMILNTTELANEEQGFTE